jgi:hypothetical protein
LDAQEPALFLRDRLHEGLYCRHKDKGYTTEAVTTVKKLPLDDLEDIKDDSDDAQKTIPRRLLSWKKIKDTRACCQQ